MDRTYKVAVMIGSLRKASYNKMTARALMALAPPALSFEVIEMGDLPIYNVDLDGEAAPRAWIDFRQQVRACDALLFVTPEYNRSVPGVLKNAIDVGSRPYGKSSWHGKPGAVVTVTAGALGGFGANHHLRQMLVFLDVPTMQQPEAYISNATKLFDEEGNLIAEPTREFFEKFMSAFAAWIARFS